jgi:hypothetical protein
VSMTVAPANARRSFRKGLRITGSSTDGQFRWELRAFVTDRPAHEEPGRWGNPTRQVKKLVYAGLDYWAWLGDFNRKNSATVRGSIRVGPKNPKFGWVKAVLKTKDVGPLLDRLLEEKVYGAELAPVFARSIAVIAEPPGPQQATVDENDRANRTRNRAYLEAAAAAGHEHARERLAELDADDAEFGEVEPEGG